MPAYVSVNFQAQSVNTNLDPAITSPACVTIDVRGHAREAHDGYMHEGPTARVVLTLDEFKVFVRDMVVRAIAEGLL